MIAQRIAKIVNGPIGVIGSNVLKPVDMEQKQDTEEKAKKLTMKAKNVKEITHKAENVSSKNVLR